MRIPILTPKSNYYWTNFIQSASYGRDWEEIYNWMHGSPAFSCMATRHLAKRYRMRPRNRSNRSCPAIAAIAAASQSQQSQLSPQPQWLLARDTTSALVRDAFVDDQPFRIHGMLSCTNPSSAIETSTYRCSHQYTTGDPNALPGSHSERRKARPRAGKPNRVYHE